MTTCTGDEEDVQVALNDLRERVCRLEEQLQKTKRNVDEDQIDMNTEFDEASIEKYVDGLLENENVNLSFVPDYVEKKMYVKMFGSILRVIQGVLGSSHMCLMNHRMRIVMEPMP